jgi:hypothetical protein
MTALRDVVRGVFIGENVGTAVLVEPDRLHLGHREFGRSAQVQRRQRSRDPIAVADDDRQHARRIEVSLGHAGDLCDVDAVHARRELAEIVIGQLVQGELSGCARNLVSGLEVPGIARVSAAFAMFNSASVAGR